MAGGISISVKGISELKKRFKEIPSAVAEEVDLFMGVAAADFEDRAATAAPVDLGRLRGGIKVEKVKEMDWRVTSYVEYSAYVEFGTRSSVNVPPDLKDYALQFKTSDGTGVGMPARPFFFKQRRPVTEQLLKDVGPAIQNALKK
jgi:HK97 gp10 family phage protein